MLVFFVFPEAVFLLRGLTLCDIKLLAVLQGEAQ